MLNLRKKLLVSIFTLMLALVAVSTTTYAWFTMGAEAKVSNIELSVQGVEGLKVRITEINGVNTTTVSALGSHTNDLQIADDYLAGIALEPMTLGAVVPAEFVEGGVATPTDYDTLYTTNYVSSTKSLSYTAVEEYTYKGNSEGNTAVTGNYLEIEFEFLAETDKTSVDVILEKVEFVIPTGFTFNSDANFSLNDDPDDNDAKVQVTQALNTVRLVNALRFAYSGQEVNDGTKGNPDTFAAGSAYKVVNPSLLAQNVDGQAKDLGNWGLASVNYFNAVNNSDIEAPAEYSAAYVALDNSVVTLKTSSYYTGLIGRATLRIWLEGWDADCFNAIIKDSIGINVQFNIKQTA